MILILTATCLLMGAMATIFFYAPFEANQGLVQKIFYIHVPSAITMYLGFFISFLFSVLYLIQKKRRLFQLSQSSLESAYVFSTIVLTTGPLWAKPIWGAYWTWEPRLTTTFIMWMMYSAYLLLYSYFREVRREGYAILSVISIVAFFNVPLIHFSVRLWRGVHPSVLRNKEGLPPSMQVTLIVALIAMVFLYLVLFRQRFRIHKMETRLHQLFERQHHG